MRIIKAIELIQHRRRERAEEGEKEEEANVAMCEKRISSFVRDFYGRSFMNE